ncbi:MAG TPA: toll/interleukin-1 receptor domain-containing protein [Kofleriaceae bacterium]
MTYDIFLAYAGADIERARTLYGLLAPQLKVFLAAETLQPGDNWADEISKAQRESKMTVLLVSSAAESAYYLREEITSAIDISRARPQEHRTIPVYLDGIPRDTNEILYGLRNLQAIDAPNAGGLPGVAQRLKALTTQLDDLPPLQPVAKAGTAASQNSVALELHDRLCRLTLTEFETFLLRSGVSRELIPSELAPTGLRAVSVVQLLQQEGSEALVRALSALRVLDETQPRTQSHRNALVLVGIVALALGGGAGYLLIERDSRTLPSLTASIAATQEIPLIRRPQDKDGEPVYAESSRCQVNFGHNQRGDVPIRVTSIAMEHESVPLTEEQRRSFDYDIDVANLRGHGIVEERQYEFAITGPNARGRYLANKDRADVVHLDNILARPEAAESVSIAGKADDAYFGFTAILNLHGASAFERVRFVATYDVAGRTNQHAATQWIYVYRK